MSEGKLILVNQAIFFGRGGVGGVGLVGVMVFFRVDRVNFFFAILFAGRDFFFGAADFLVATIIYLEQRVAEGVVGQV